MIPLQEKHISYQAVSRHDFCELAGSVALLYFSIRRTSTWIRDWLRMIQPAALGGKSVHRVDRRIPILVIFSLQRLTETYNERLNRKRPAPINSFETLARRFTVVLLMLKVIRATSTI